MLKMFLLFLFGMICSEIILPIFECLRSILTQYTQYICTKIAKRTYNIQKSMETNEISTNVIGFQVPSDDEYYDEEDE